jgi:peptidylprolyl isomerase
MHLRLLQVALLAVGSAAAGCGGGGGGTKDSGIPDGSETATAAAVIPAKATPAVDAAKTYAKGTAVEPIANAKDLAKQPGIPKPSGAAPKQLVVRDLVTGTGAAAQDGDALTVRYVGASYSTGKVFDASWKSAGNAFPFTLGQQAVIGGWDKGIVGMKPGGRRELVIPPDLGYGAQGQGSSIKPNETLIFVVDLKKIG